MSRVVRDTLPVTRSTVFATISATSFATAANGATSGILKLRRRPELL